MNDNTRSVLSKIWYGKGDNLGASFGGPSKLYHAAKKYLPGLTLTTVNDFLKRQPAYISRHEEAKNTVFKRWQPSSDQTQQYQPGTPPPSTSAAGMEVISDNSEDSGDDDERIKKGIEKAKKEFSKFLNDGIQAEFRHSAVLIFNLLENPLTEKSLEVMLTKASEYYFKKKRDIAVLYLVPKLGFLLGGQDSSSLDFFEPGWNSTLTQYSIQVKRYFMTSDIQSAVRDISDRDFATKMTTEYAEKSDTLLIIPLMLQLSVFFRK